jgi:hypothetical protein
MASTRTRRPSSRRRPPTALGKPRGVLHPRVQQVGPEHFGIVCFDCAKVRSKFLLADFYGRLLLPPTLVAHTRPALDAAVTQIRQAFEQHQLRDGLVAIERAGRYLLFSHRQDVHVVRYSNPDKHSFSGRCHCWHCCQEGDILTLLPERNDLAAEYLPPCAGKDCGPCSCT